MGHSGCDSLKTNINEIGAFEFNGIKPGKYQLIIDAVAPLTDRRFDISVAENQVVNIGEVKLN